MISNGPTVSKKSVIKSCTRLSYQYVHHKEDNREFYDGASEKDAGKKWKKIETFTSSGNNVSIIFCIFILPFFLILYGYHETSLLFQCKIVIKIIAHSVIWLNNLQCKRRARFCRLIFQFRFLFLFFHSFWICN